MRQLGEYVVTLTAAALVCSILLPLFSEGTVKSLVRLLCGIFLTVTAFSPLADWEIPDFCDYLGEYTQAGEAAAAMGAELASQAENEIIKQRLEAYILDKALSLGLTLQAEVTLREDGTPESVRIFPEPEPDRKKTLSDVIATDLGIPKENQQWTTQEQKKP